LSATSSGPVSAYFTSHFSPSTPSPLGPARTTCRASRIATAGACFGFFALMVWRLLQREVGPAVELGNEDLALGPRVLLAVEGHLEGLVVIELLDRRAQLLDERPGSPPPCRPIPS